MSDAATPRAPTETGRGSLFDVEQSVCTHPREMWRFLHTIEDFYAGDEDDIYECLCCGKRIVEYVPR